MELDKIVIFIVVVITAALAGLIYLYTIGVYLTLKLRGRRTAGSVVEVRIEHEKDADGQETGKMQRNPVFSFEADGRRVTGMPRYMTADNYQVGDEVDITYHAGKPHIFVASDEIERKRLWPGFVFLVVLFGGIIFLFLRFWDTGHIVEGAVRKLAALWTLNG